MAKIEKIDLTKVPSGEIVNKLVDSNNEMDNNVNSLGENVEDLTEIVTKLLAPKDSPVFNGKVSIFGELYVDEETEFADSIYVEKNIITSGSIRAYGDNDLNIEVSEDRDINLNTSAYGKVNIQRLQAPGILTEYIEGIGESLHLYGDGRDVIIESHDGSDVHINTNNGRAYYNENEIATKADLISNVQIPPITLEYESGYGEGGYDDRVRNIICFARCEQSFIDFLENGGRCQLWLFGLFKSASTRNIHLAGSIQTIYRKNQSKWIHPKDRTPIAPPRLFTDEQWNYGNAGQPTQGGWGIALVGSGKGFAAKPDVSHSTTNGFIPTEFEITSSDLITLLDGSKAIRKIIPFNYFEDNLVYRFESRNSYGEDSREGHLLFCRHRNRSGRFDTQPERGISSHQLMKAELVINDNGVKRNGICANKLRFEIMANINKNSQHLGCRVIN